MRSALRSAANAKSRPSITRRLRPGMRHRSNRRVAVPSACTARTCSSPSEDDSHNGCATCPSNSGSSATSQPPAGKRHHALATSPIRAVARMPAQVLPGKSRVVEVQHVEIGGGHTPWGAGKVFGVGWGHGILLWKEKPATKGKLQGRFYGEATSRAGRSRNDCVSQSLIEPSRCASAR